MNSARRGAMEAARLATAGRVAEAASLLKRTLADKGLNSDRVGTNGPEAMLGALPEALRGLLDRVGLADFLMPGTAPAGGATAARPGPADQGQGRFLQLSYGNAAGSRPYKLYVPSGYRGRPSPLIVMLHGCTQSPDDFAAGTRMNLAADAESCFVAYPGQTSAANHSKCWNWFNPEDQRRDRGETSLIAGITREVMSNYAIDPSRVYIAGLSAGGAAAANIASAYPELYAAAAVHSGLACGAAHDMSSAFMAMRKGAGTHARGSAGPNDAVLRAGAVPTIVFHGDHDGTVHPSNGDEVVAQATGTLTPRLEKMADEGRVPGGRSYTRIRYREPNGRVVCEQWVIHGAGHSWSGGSPAGSYTDPSGPDATSAMLRFFLEHPRR